MELTIEESWLRVEAGGVELARYVFAPWDARLESPRPYFHPLRTLAGDVVSLYRPHDHVWHKGIAWSLPNVGSANFWGGPTYLRGRGYEQLANNGTTRHLSFDPAGPSSVTESLAWDTEQGERWFTETRTLTFTVGAQAWTLGFATSFTNVTDVPIVLGSPTTEGRENAGYGGLFWRGPRSFTGGRVTVPGRTGGDELMGVRAPWLAFHGRHDGHDRHSTLVFTAEDEPKWFVRSTPFAAVCPAPFFDTEVTVAPGETRTYRHTVTIADGDPDPASLAG
ncbi:MAG TPA: PmoA family protein [Actinophytocola sp.]|nr:PmoA family protein [Actinophytocola sp.]